MKQIQIFRMKKDREELVTVDDDIYDQIKAYKWLIDAKGTVFRQNFIRTESGSFKERHIIVKGEKISLLTEITGLSCRADKVMFRFLDRDKKNFTRANILIIGRKGVDMRFNEAKKNGVTLFPEYSAKKRPKVASDSEKQLKAWCTRHHQSWQKE